MKRFVQLFVLVLFILAATIAVQPAHAQQGLFTSAYCDAGSQTLTVTLNLSGTTDIFMLVTNPFYDLGNFTVTGTGSVTFTFTDSHLVAGAIVAVVKGDESTDITATCTEQACLNLDDRLNPVCVYPEQSAAIYCREHNIVIYAVNESIGYYAFTMTPEQLAEFPAKPEHNILIKQRLGARLYKLTSGKYQVNRIKPDGKEYSFIFEGC